MKGKKDRFYKRWSGSSGCHRIRSIKVNTEFQPSRPHTRALEILSLFFVLYFILSLTFCFSGTKCVLNIKMASLVFYIGKSAFYMFFYMDFYIIEILPPITGSSIEASLTHLLAMHYAYVDYVISLTV